MHTMWLSEAILYRLAKSLYSGEIAQSREMKEALSSETQYNEFRGVQLDRICEAARRYGVDFCGKTLLDVGCNDGAITCRYIDRGAARVIGVDIDRAAIDRATADYANERVSFVPCTTTSIPLEDNAVDVIVCYDVFEHISQPRAVVEEWHRLLRPGGKALIGTWGWYHPYAHHLWSTMPVPWAHVVCSEKTMIRVCRRVFESPWYVPTIHDLDGAGNKRTDMYLDAEIGSEWLNKLLIRNFEKLFAQSRFRWETHLQPFGSRWARWTKPFLKVPWLREFVTGYVWFVLSKQAVDHAF
jgi:SAM-dependent methyltransferase